MGANLLIDSDLNRDLSFSLDKVWQEVQNLLGSFLEKNDFVTRLHSAFGNEIDLEKAIALIDGWANNDYSDLPKIEIRDSVDINGANGAYSSANNTIYLSREFITHNPNSISDISHVVLEELGHAIDSQVNFQDAPGDEGAIFASLVDENPLLEQSDLNLLRLEDDTTTTVINGQTLSLEQDTDIFITLQDFRTPRGIYVDEQQNVFISYVDISAGGIIAKFAPNGDFLSWTITPGFSDYRFASLPDSTDFLGLRPDGIIHRINPDTLQFSEYLNLRSIDTDNSFIYDITNNEIDDTESINPQIAQYNDITVRQNGSITEIFVTGQNTSAGIMPFVTRIHIEDNFITEARVLINGERFQSPVVEDEDAQEYQYGAVSLNPPGIAVNSQGTVLTTFPIFSTGQNTTPIYLVAFDAGFEPSEEANNESEIEKLSSGFLIFGMTADYHDNFHVVYNALGQAGVFVISPDNEPIQVEELGTPSLDGLARGDIAVAPNTNKAYVTFNTSVLTFSVDSVDSSTATYSASTVYRFYNPSKGVHFYTADEAEKNYVIENLDSYEFEGESYRTVDPLTGSEAEEVYRFFNSTTGVHLYTTSEAEKDYIIDNLSNFAFEGTKFYAYENATTETIPVYRFYEPSIGVHFYTPSESERAFVEQNLLNYNFEGVAYYAFPKDSTDGI